MSAPWFGGQQPQDLEKSGVLDPLLDEQGVQRISDGSHGNQHDRFTASYDHQPDGDAAEDGEHNAPAKMSWAAWLLLAAAVRCHTFDRKAFKSSCTYEAVQLSSLTILSRAAAQLTVKSSAGAVFASLPEVGAITIAAWRMQLAAVIMLPVAIWQYRHASAGDPHVSFSVNGHCCDATGDWTAFLGQKQAVNEVRCADCTWPPADVQQTTRSKFWRLVVSGVLLAVQWSAYAWAVGHTSLSHTLLFLSATPMLLAGWHWVSRQPISGSACTSQHLHARASAEMRF